MANEFGLAVMMAALILALTSSLALASPQVEPARTNTLEDASAAPKTARELFVLPKQFDFDLYQKVFHKTYSSALDRMVRAKLYLGRAFRAFISKVSYKHGKVSSYLGINHMSDWTPAEVRQTVMDADAFLANSEEGGRKSLAEAPNDHRETSESSIDDSTPVADVPSIKITLRRVVEDKDQDPAFKEIAEELESETVGPSELRELSPPDGDNEAGVLTEMMTPLSAGESASIRDKDSRGFLHGLVNDLSSESNKQAVRGVSRPLPDEIFIDYRGCLHRPRNQGKCGCCYAFSTIALYEWAYCKATGKKVAFSEQFALDCTSDKVGINGCTHGYPFAVREFSMVHGLQLLDKYPFKEKEQECKYDSSLPLKTRSYVVIHDQGAKFLRTDEIEHQLKKSPFVMAVQIKLGVFHEYAGGVDMGKGCSGHLRSPHGMLLVGSGREDGQEYWLLRNSFGPDWGEKGHYKLNKKSKCIIDNNGLVINF